MALVGPDFTGPIINAYFHMLDRRIQRVLSCPGRTMSSDEIARDRQTQALVFLDDSPRFEQPFPQRTLQPCDDGGDLTVFAKCERCQQNQTRSSDPYTSLLDANSNR
jgi:hypothetical protein